MNRQGFTLVELIVAMLLFSIVGTSVYQLLVTNQRVYREQVNRVDANSNARTAIAMLPTELRELNAGDTLQSDIVSMSSTQITYKRMRNLYLLCQDPNVAAGQVSVYRNWFGSSALNATTDSLVLFADGNQMRRDDDTWIHAYPSAISNGSACPGGGPSATITLQGIAGGTLNDVFNGAPLRSYDIVQILLYTDGGDGWMGRRVLSRNGTWTAVEAVLGPLDASGMEFKFFESDGTETSNEDEVVRIEIEVNAVTPDPVRRPDGSLGVLDVNLVTNVALRNNPRS